MLYYDIQPGQPVDIPVDTDSMSAVWKNDEAALMI